MYDKGKVLAGLAVFVVFMTFPFWFNIGATPFKAPELAKPKDAKNCVESVEWMKTEHMQLLNDWRDMVVREGTHEYHSRFNGKEYLVSLSKTCMKCHDDKEKFCDKCHDSLAVSPYCWDCHVAPKGENQ
ncbi:MAG: cytochrome C [Deltaproteobacteria bacterium]|nr:cytochrome C [Deltaproteobacteria bacterium]